MTDNDIIKALDICAVNEGCPNCPYYDTTHNDCFGAMLLDIRGFINRKEEDIERLTVELKAMRGAANSYKMHYNKAINEFSDRLSERFMKYTEYDEGGWGSTIYAVKVEDIYSLVKEMTEGDK